LFFVFDSNELRIYAGFGSGCRLLNRGSIWGAGGQGFLRVRDLAYIKGGLSFKVWRLGCKCCCYWLSVVSFASGKSDIFFAPERAKEEKFAGSIKDKTGGFILS
jgi:hypothetical protein